MPPASAPDPYDAYDVRRTLAYGREKLARNFRHLALVAVAVGAVSVFVAGDDVLLRIVGWGLVVAGFGLGAWELSKSIGKQEPLLVLSPEGIRLHIEDVKTIAIPWSEVSAVHAINVPVTVPGHGNDLVRDVTAVDVSQAFYDRAIDVDSLFLRGPGWANTFIPAGGVVQVALHHDILPVSGPELLAAVTARWKAFGRPARPS